MTKRAVIAGIVDVIVMFSIMSTVSAVMHNEWVGLGAATFVAAYGAWSYYDGATRCLPHK